MTLKQIGQNVKNKRKEMKLTQAQLAELINLSNNHVSHIECGSGKMSLDTLLTLCQALNTTPNEILLGEYLNPHLADKLFDNPSSHLTFDDKVLLQQIYRLLGERNK